MTWQPTLGAILSADGVTFRVWAPDRQQLEVALYTEATVVALHPLTREADGHWSGFVPGVTAGARYMFRLDGALDRPDPAARHQPTGVHGPSMVVDPAFGWTDRGWHGVPHAELIVYELHVGTATPDGTFEALIARLPELRDLGITAIELLPIADFPGERGWGYDGVCLYAPARAYGGGAGLQRLVDAAHAAGLAVLLDVVYNHLGPSGNYLRDFAKDYFTARHHTPWGAALNFDGPGSAAVRRFFIENALSWVHEYHIDGFRLDATQEIIDDSPEHLLQALMREVRASLPPTRHFSIVAEDARNETRLARSVAEGGYGLDGVWADDFSHVVRVTLTGEQEGYLAAYQGGAEQLATVLRAGWLYQGQPDPFTGLPRGTPAAILPRTSFVYAIQTHDHVGNRAFGERLSHDVSAAAYRAAAVLLLLAPGIPLLFMGQEWAATTPFQFFTDHDAALGALVTEGRRKDYAQFAAFQGADVPDPQALSTFTRSTLRWEERITASHAAILRLYRDLIALRRRTPFYRTLERAAVAVSVIGAQAVALRLGEQGQSLLVAVCLGGTATLDRDTLAGNPGGWALVMDSEAQEYGGEAPATELRDRMEIEGPRALVLRGN